MAFVESLGSRSFDGHVVLMPSAFALSEAERVDFYTASADAARLPVFLYELTPVPNGTLSLPALVGLARHPNIAGIKISAGLAKARRLRELVDGDFRVIPADPQLLDFCALAGPWTEHLDGIFAACPQWAAEVRDEAARGNAAAAASAQSKINGLLQQWIATGQIFAAFTATMNARGISGRYHPRPMRDLPAEVAEAMLASPELAALTVVGLLRSDTRH